MTHDAPPPRLLDSTTDDALRGDLRAVAALDVGYDVQAGAARFDAAIAAGTAGSAGGTVAAAKTGLGWLVAVGIVAGGGLVVALSGEPSPRTTTTTREPSAPTEPARRHDREPTAPAIAPPSTIEHDDAPTTEPAVTAPPREDSEPKKRVPNRAQDRDPAAPQVAAEDALAREMQATHAAKRALAKDPARALALAEAADAEFPRGSFAPDREGIAILALFALGRDAQATTRARSFLAAHPKGTYADSIRAVLGDEKP